MLCRLIISCHSCVYQGNKFHSLFWYLSAFHNKCLIGVSYICWGVVYIKNSRRHVLYILISCLTARAPFAHETKPRTNMTYTISSFLRCVTLTIEKHFVWFFAKIKVPLWVLYKLSTFGQQKWVVSCRWFNNTLNNGSPR